MKNSPNYQLRTLNFFVSLQTKFVMTMTKRIALMALVLLFTVVQVHAVLKERDIEKTLGILRTELVKYHDELERQTSFVKDQQEQIRKNLFTVLNRSNQNALMLYSQKSEYIFDLTYACHEATEQYNEFQRNVLPFRSFIDKTNEEIARYDSLIINLTSMPTMSLSSKASIDRNVCLTLAVNIRRTLKENRDQLNDYINYYQNTEQQLKSLNDYANKRYGDIQMSIFNNGGDN